MGSAVCAHLHTSLGTELPAMAPILADNVWLDYSVQTKRRSQLSWNAVRIGIRITLIRVPGPITHMSPGWTVCSASSSVRPCSTCWFGLIPRNRRKALPAGSSRHHQKLFRSSASHIGNMRRTRPCSGSRRCCCRNHTRESELSFDNLRIAVLAIALAIATPVAADTSFMQSTRHIDRCKERARAPACTARCRVPPRIRDYDPFADMWTG
jgi:hypothetical protein